jgi:hypothetical protein
MKSILYFNNLLDENIHTLHYSSLLVAMLVGEFFKMFLLD